MKAQNLYERRITMPCGKGSKKGGKKKPKGGKK